MITSSRIGINGFGRIGRYFTRLIIEQSEINFIVVNDLVEFHILVHLLKYDSIHGKLKINFEVVHNEIHFESGKKILFLNNREPQLIPWKLHDIDLVIESSGLFLTKVQAEKHFVGGAKKVIISAPPKDRNIKTIVLGVNEQLISKDDVILSNASCTTNSIAPILNILQEICEIESAFINTIHSYTTDQSLHDSPHQDLRRGRAAGLSIIPTTTSAATAITLVFPELQGKIAGSGIRVPVPNGSLTELTLVVKDSISVQKINESIKKASNNSMKGIIVYSEESIVSIDILGNSASCVFDSTLTTVIGNTIKVVTWYDNESGYSNRLLELVKIFS